MLTYKNNLINDEMIRINLYRYHIVHVCINHITNKIKKNHIHKSCFYFIFMWSILRIDKGKSKGYINNFY